MVFLRVNEWPVSRMAHSSRTKRRSARWNAGRVTAATLTDHESGRTTQRECERERRRARQRQSERARERHTHTHTHTKTQRQAEAEAEAEAGRETAHALAPRWVQVGRGWTTRDIRELFLRKHNQQCSSFRHDNGATRSVPAQTLSQCYLHLHLVPSY